MHIEMAMKVRQPPPLSGAPAVFVVDIVMLYKNSKWLPLEYEALHRRIWPRTEAAA